MALPCRTDCRPLRPSRILRHGTLRWSRWARDNQCTAAGALPRQRNGAAAPATVHSLHSRATAVTVTAAAAAALAAAAAAPPPPSAASAAVLSAAIPALHAARARHHGCAIPIGGPACRRRHRSRPLADPEQRRGPQQKTRSCEATLASPLSSWPPLWPNPLDRRVSTISLRPLLRRKHAYALVRHASSPSQRIAQILLPLRLCPLTPLGVHWPVTPGVVCPAALTTTASLRGAPLPSPSLPLPRSSQPRSFPFLSFLFAPSSQSHFVEVGKPSARSGREPRSAPRGRGQGSGLSPESSSFLNNNSSPLRRESDVYR